MAEKTLSHHDTINEALQLDGDADSLKAFYRDWAGRYESDLRDVDYAAPEIAAKLIARHHDRANVPDPSILDAGCGTGLVGAELLRHGFATIDGFDLSPDMADLARGTGFYRDVAGDINLLDAVASYPVPYDIVVCAGVFTLGHVPPSALAVLRRLARPGGLIVVSTRTLYFDRTDYRLVSDGLVAEGALTFVDRLMDAPYKDDGRSHYWVYRAGPETAKSEGARP